MPSAILHARRPRCADANYHESRTREKERKRKGDRTRSVHLTHRSPYQSCDLRVRTTHEGTSGAARARRDPNRRPAMRRTAEGCEEAAYRRKATERRVTERRARRLSCRRRRTITRDDSPASAFGMRARVLSRDVSVGEPGSRHRASLLLLQHREDHDHRCARLVPRSALTAMNACACGNRGSAASGMASSRTCCTQRARVEHGAASPARPAGAGATASAGAGLHGARRLRYTLIAPAGACRWLVGEAPLPFELVAMGGAPTAPPQCLHAPAHVSRRQLSQLSRPHESRRACASFPLPPPGLPRRGERAALSWCV